MMTDSEKRLLKTDLSGRLPYDVVLFNTGPDDESVGFNCLLTGEMLDKLCNKYETNTYEFVPYLRPLDDMTKEEEDEFYRLNFTDFSFERVDWLNKHGFDYRGLIPLNLAIKAPVGMYKF